MKFGKTEETPAPAQEAHETKATHESKPTLPSTSELVSAAASLTHAGIIAKVPPQQALENALAWFHAADQVLAAAKNPPPKTEDKK